LSCARFLTVFFASQLVLVSFCASSSCLGFPNRVNFSRTALTVSITLTASCGYILGSLDVFTSFISSKMLKVMSSTTLGMSLAPEVLLNSFRSSTTDGLSSLSVIMLSSCSLLCGSFCLVWSLPLVFHHFPFLPSGVGFSFSTCFCASLTAVTPSFSAIASLTAVSRGNLSRRALTSIPRSAIS
jgi:hypothetical protein